ncbi:MAG: hypothetical protein RL217_242 [Pseudomonadota bacterium]|jgi:CysZ protein
MRGSLKQGFAFFVQGLRALSAPQYRLYVWLPLLLNAVLMGAATYWAVQLLDTWVTQLVVQLPSWLAFLYWLLMPLALLAVMLLLAYSFSTLLMLVLAPLCGLLSEKVDRQAGVCVPAEPWYKLLWRTLKRELIKLAYLLPRYLLLLLLGWIPVVNILAPLLWLLFMAWFAALQYVNYAFDNHRLSFADLRKASQQERLTFLGFGLPIALVLMVPILNWFVMPAAVIGGTLLSQERQLRTKQTR